MVWLKKEGLELKKFCGHAVASLKANPIKHFFRVTFANSDKAMVKILKIFVRIVVNCVIYIRNLQQ